MEPDIMPMYSSSPPPLDYDVEAEEDEFGDFGGFSVISCSAHTDFNEHPRTPRQASPSTEPGTPPPSFKQPVEQSQPASTVKSGCSSGQVDEEGQHCNGYSARDHPSGTHEVSLPGEETGFADFSVFTEQAAHPWCCGFAPVGTEGWEGREGDVNLPDSSGEKTCDSGQEAVMNSEPRSHCTSKAKEDICTKVNHCEKRDAALVQPSQGHHQPQEPAAAQDFPSEETQPGEEEFEEPEESRKETRCSPSQNFYSSQTSESEEERKSVGGEEERENSISPPSHTASLYESAAEDLTLFCDALTPDSPSADCELKVPCLDFEADEPDWGHQGDEEEEEEPEDSKPADSVVDQGVGDLSQSQSETPATQETSATSNQSESETYAGDDFADFKHGGFELENQPPTDKAEDPWPSLPPSDSFADFCSASTHEDGDGSWVEFRGPGTQVEEDRPWTQFAAQDGSQQTEGATEEECGSSEGSRCQTSLSGRVQKLLHVTFPGAPVPAAEREEEEEEEEEEVFDLAALLQAQDRPSSGKEEMEETSLGTQGVQWGMCWQLQDVHSAVGLKFQWGGSHTNRTLLRCLGVDTKNIVFVGMKKQPMVVPAFASGLGMLEPSKDSCSPGHTADRLDPSTDSLKEPLPPRQLDCSSSGLSSSQDGVTSQASLVIPQQQTPAASPLALNLDYFGPVEEKESSSSSSRSTSPPPGVDRELYELTISKLETSVVSNHGEDTLNRLMSTAETTSTSVRANQQVEELSAEATMVISVLPDLSFMMAKVLMFPSILTSKECCIPTSE